MIRKLKHNQIDKAKWDKVIASSNTPHVYVLSWYLDIVSPGWECLIWDDYRWVMPLPVKRKWGIPYLVQPLFCQKLSIYGIDIKPEQARLFYKKLFWNYLYYNLTIESPLGFEKKKNLNSRINIALDLTSSYNVLTKNYDENTQRNIKKATNAELFASECFIDEFCSFCNTNLKGLTSEEFIIFKSLISSASEQKVTRLIKIENTQGEILSAACFIIWNKQLLYLAGASSALGKQQSAMFLLFDKIIKEYSETGWLIDFEGSMIPGVVRFFKGFGGKSSEYYHLKKYLFFYH